ncbi:MAG: T9SS type A sorting domain-containing protein [Bacteroidia bacterium]|nr:T9SS type A sorting domain-containing protein [Bacteroidia bacterium]
MTKSFYLVALCSFLFSAGISVQAQENKVSPPVTANIDQFDSVVFDLSQAVVANGYLEFPVYFKTDDVIYSLDFSLKYNQTKYLYDTIIDMTTYLLDNSFYNQFDSTIRFTSSSLTPIPNLTQLVKVRFDTITTSLMCFGDIFTLKGYLNGDQCSVKLVDCNLLSVSENSFNHGSIVIFPVPSKEVIHVRMNELIQNAVISMTDLSGRIIEEQNHQIVQPGSTVSFETGNLSDGVYLVTVKSGRNTFTGKAVINK